MGTLKTDYSKRMLIGVCSLVYFISYFSRKDFAAVMAGMISEGVIDKPLGGFIGMGLFICYGAGQLISGYLGDKIKPRTLMLVGILTTCACNLAMPLVATVNAYVMIPIWALNGLAQAMLWPPIVRILAENLDHEGYIKGNLVVTVAAHAATILLYVFVPLCLEFFAWDTVFYVASAAALISVPIFILALHLVLPDDKGENTAKLRDIPDSSLGTAAMPDSDKESFLKLISRAGIIPLFVCIVMMGYLRDGIESWLPTLYSEVFQREASESVLVSIVLPIFSIVSIFAITAAHKTRLFKNEARGSMILFICCIVLSVPLYLLMDAKSIVLRIICLVMAALICGCMHACNFLLISCLPGYFASYGKSATASGVCNACTYIGAAGSMYGIAAIADNYGWDATIISWIIIAAVGVAFAVMALARFTKFINEAE